MTVDLERVRSVLQAAAEALADLGACDDEDCQEPNCNHALSRVRELLAELWDVTSPLGHLLPAAIQLRAKQRHVLLCPECASELRTREIRIVDGNPTWEMACRCDHRWLLSWDLWDEPEARVFVWGPVDDKANG